MSSGGGFITVAGKVIPVGDKANDNAGGKTTKGPKQPKAPKPVKSWDDGANKKGGSWGKAPPKMKFDGEGKLPSKPVKPAKAPKAPKGSHGSSAPLGHAPRSGHPHHPAMGEHSSTAEKVSHALSSAGHNPLGAVSNLVHTAMAATDPMKPMGHH